MVTEQSMLKRRFDVWWRLLRPFTLTASIVPTLVGTGLAVGSGQFHTGRFGLFLIASILIQSATNMFNEYFDFRRGLDTAEMVGIAGTIVKDGVSAGTVLRLAWLFVGSAVAIGLYLSAVTSWWVFVTGIACIGVAYLYSGGPLPLAYTPLGELAAATVMGPVIVLLAYYIQTGNLMGRVVIVSLSVGMLIGALLMANHLRDIEHDRLGGRKTIAILLGRSRGRILLGTVLALAYLIVLVLILLGLVTPWTLLVLITLPEAVEIMRRFYRSSVAAELHPAVKGVSSLLLHFGMLQTAALLLGTWITVWTKP